MKIIELFAGIAGLGLGLKAGLPDAEIIQAVELNPYRRAVHERHFPEALHHVHDVRSAHRWYQALDGAVFLAGAIERGDLVCGGFPCTDISVAGKGAGIHGKHSSLWFQFLRMVRELRPGWVVIENTPALRKRGLGAVLHGLAALGYDAEWTTFGAVDVGAPHRRKRMWIIAWHPDRIHEGAEWGQKKGAGTQPGGAGDFSDTNEGGRGRDEKQPISVGGGGGAPSSWDDGKDGRVANAEADRIDDLSNTASGRRSGQGRERREDDFSGCDGAAWQLADADEGRREEQRGIDRPGNRGNHALDNAHGRDGAGFISIPGSLRREGLLLAQSAAWTVDGCSTGQGQAEPPMGGAADGVPAGVDGASGGAPALPTPTARDANGPSRGRNAQGGQGLEQAVMYPTPIATEARKEPTRSLSRVVHTGHPAGRADGSVRSTWPTPKASDGDGRGGMASRDTAARRNLLDAHENRHACPVAPWERGIPRTTITEPNRRQRVEAFGLAVVPQCSYRVGLRVDEIRRECGAYC